MARYTDRRGVPSPSLARGSRRSQPVGARPCPGGPGTLAHVPVPAALRQPERAPGRVPAAAGTGRPVRRPHPRRCHPAAPRLLLRPPRGHRAAAGTRRRPRGHRQRRQNRPAQGAGTAGPGEGTRTGWGAWGDLPARTGRGVLLPQGAWGGSGVPVPPWGDAGDRPSRPLSRGTASSVPSSCASARPSLPSAMPAAGPRGTGPTRP